MELIFEISKNGKKAYTLPECDISSDKQIEQKYLRKQDARLVEVSELDVIRHFTALSKMNFSVDSNFYPLGSCTMKYNPKFTEYLASLDGFCMLHPLLPQIKGGEKLSQGALTIIYELEKLLCEITGMDEFTSQPMAGAHGELTGIMIIAHYHKLKGEQRKIVLIPDLGHGTNPASAAIAGYQVRAIPSGKDGLMDMGCLKKELTKDVAAIMLTCPDTLGIFNPKIKEIADLAHKAGALMYYDGANLNAILGKARPGDLGFDVVHLNLHKTFATPHGGGGPGAGPVGVKKELAKYLPIPRIKQDKGELSLDFSMKFSIGNIAPFYGNFLVLVKAYAYIILLGGEGLVEASENAVLNANYIMHKLKDYYDLPFKRACMHECVFSASKQSEKGVHAIDIAKALIDKGIHPPTVYFPLIVKEAMMIEPTETESKQTLDNFISIMIEIAKLADKDPQKFKEFPKTTPVKRLDEVKAAKDLNLSA
ncbi:MAG: aminomethyl-transferring glycine dehydrogenase subunit GcvPB [Candidatus Omnitrophica bacterium]|nr:aminomethyl-transferring glycine dehydrogenase subunit GcvPB [Candidatus Omnitrophota bacterium]